MESLFNDDVFNDYTEEGETQQPRASNFPAVERDGASSIQDEDNESQHSWESASTVLNVPREIMWSPTEWNNTGYDDPEERFQNELLQPLMDQVVPPWILRNISNIMDCGRGTWAFRRGQWEVVEHGAPDDEDDVPDQDFPMDLQDFEFGLQPEDNEPEDNDPEDSENTRPETPVNEHQPPNPVPVAPEERRPPSHRYPPSHRHHPYYRL